jgi:long-chain acyl-CoA synthetase
MVKATYSIVDMAAAAAARHAGRTAFTCLGASLSYQRLDELSAAFALWLGQDRTLQPGDRVALQLPNLLQYPVAALGVLRAGLVIVNVNPLYTASELQHQLQDAGAKVLVVTANTAHVAARIIADTSVEQVVVTEIGDLHPWPRRPLLNLAIRHVKKLVPDYRFAACVSFRETLRKGRALAAGCPDALRARAPHAEALAVLQYTGGTTGTAKGAMLSHHNLVANMLQVCAALGTAAPAPGSLMVAPLPLYHVYAFTMNFLVGLHQGQHMLLIPNPRDMPAFMRALRGRRINGFIGINTLYRALCDNPEFRALDFSALQLSSSGGMALAPQVAARWQELTGCVILEGYGLSECSPLVSCNRHDDRRAGTVGKPVEDTDVVILGTDGREVPAEEAGEICVRGPQVMRGYWQRPVETAQVLDANGWLHTGDIGIIDAQGYLRVVDRIKDMLIISGFNVYPNEIEDHVCCHPDIRDAAVIGTGDAYEVCIRLYVVTSNATLTEAHVLSWCREGLAPYKVPKAVEFRASLPKSTVGKVLRRELREQPGSAPE